MKNTNTKIPFVDLHSQYRALKKDIDSAIFNVINSSSFIRGPFVDKFEEEFAEKIGVDNCISCANGTDAIYIGLKALDIKDN